MVFKRVALLVVTNLLVVAVLGVVLAVVESVWGVRLQGGWWGALLGASLFGFGGSFLSLLMSRRMALWTTGARVLEPAAPAAEADRWLLASVRRLAERSGLPMPMVAVYDAPEPNAFATGPSRRSSLVAVSTGLLATMNREEVEAVLAHEISHVANGDMVTLTLLQGVLNTFVLLLARVIGQTVDRVVFQNRDGAGVGYAVTSVVAQIVLGLLASLVVCAFSRWREFRADAGSARLVGPDAMVAALQRLGRPSSETDLPDSVRAFGIRGNTAWSRLWSTHPPLSDRIAALRQTSFP